MARGVLVSALADKQLRLSQAEAKRSAIATLMTADVEGITTELSSIHSIWGYLVDAVLGLYALSRFIGVATVVVLGPLLRTSSLPFPDAANTAQSILLTAS